MDTLNTKELSALGIIIVGENDHDIEAFRMILQKAKKSYEIIAFVNAEEAMDKIVQGALQFDVVIVDYLLPGMNGLEFIEKLITNKITEPKIILTGLGFEEVAVQAMIAGANDYIIKDTEQGYLKLLPVVVSKVLQKYDDKFAGRTAEKALSESEERYRDLFESSFDGIAESNLEGDLIRCNPAYAKMTGYTESELKKLKYQDLTPERWKGVDKKHIQQCIKRGYSDLYEKERLMKDGSVIPVSMRVWTRKDGSGNPIGFWGIVQDITERKLTEKRINLNMEILNIINKSGDWKGCIEDILHKIKLFFGLEAVGIRLRKNEDFPYFVTKGFPEFFVEAERYLCTRDSLGEMIRDSDGNPYVECMCGNVICGRTDADKDFFTDGGSFWSNNTSRLLSETTDEDRQTRTRNRCNSEGYESVALFPLKVGHEILGLLQVNDKRPDRFADDSIRFFEDLGISIGTAFSRKLAEDALYDAKRLSEDYINSLPGIFYVFDDQKKLVKWNRPWKKVIGYNDDELKGMSGADFVESKEKVRINESMQKVFQNGYSEIELELVTKEGRLLPYYCTGVRMTLNGKEHLIGLGIDISERKKLEEQLRQSSKMESVGTIAGGIAHDFNNLLYIVSGNAEMALEDIPEWNPVHDNLIAIEDAVLKAAGIVKQLLNFSRKTNQEFKPLGAITVIKDVLEFIRSTIPVTIEMRMDFPNDDVAIFADSVQISQVFMNICSNASQEMDGTGGILDITVETITMSEGFSNAYSELNAGDYLKISIGDTGQGIDSEIIERIFDPYFTTKEVGRGAGLGLAVVHGIVKNHNGAISVESELGMGTTFTILFPVITDQPEIQDLTADDFPHGTETILFVDDNYPIVKMVTQILERLGYKVEAFDNPLEAIELFKAGSGHFDLVITDMTMPQMTGSELSETLKAIRPDIPVIICTGHSSLIDEKKADEMGVDAFIMKPLVRNEIATTIRKVLDT